MLIMDTVLPKRSQGSALGFCAEGAHVTPAGLFLHISSGKTQVKVLCSCLKQPHEEEWDYGETKSPVFPWWNTAWMFLRLFPCTWRSHLLSCLPMALNKDWTFFLLLLKQEWTLHWKQALSLNKKNKPIPLLVPEPQKLFTGLRDAICQRQCQDLYPCKTKPSMLNLKSKPSALAR